MARSRAASSAAAVRGNFHVVWVELWPVGAAPKGGPWRAERAANDGIVALAVLRTATGRPEGGPYRKMLERGASRLVATRSSTIGSPVVIATGITPAQT